jgi:hypothetical protein
MIPRKREGLRNGLVYVELIFWLLEVKVGRYHIFVMYTPIRK